MKTNSNLILERLKENVCDTSGCSVLYLKSLKSDLSRLLKQYMALTDLEFNISQIDKGFLMDISVFTSEFFEIGKGE